MNKMASAVKLSYLLLIITQFGKTGSVRKMYCLDEKNCFIREGETIVSRATSDEIADKQQSGTREKRQAIRRFENSSNIWEEGVPYYFDASARANPKLIEEFEFAVKAWQQDTCVNFKEVQSPQLLPDTLVVTSDDVGCASHPGKLGGQQPLILGKGCEQFGHIAHELGHALGLYHTMARHDRNAFIEVKLENVQKEYQKELEMQPKERNENYEIGYDYGSIMHYPWRNAFSNNKPSMIPKDKRYRFTMGSEMISFADLWMINKLYSCEEICAQATDRNEECKNGGFPHPRKCSECLCPGGYGGNDCSKRPDDKCGKELEAKNGWQIEQLTFNNFKPKDYPDGYKKCTYWIKYPKDKRIQVRFRSIYFKEETDGCTGAGVEIKANKNQTLTGYRLCSNGKTIEDRVFTSLTNPLPVITYSRNTYFSIATISYRYLEDTDNEHDGILDDDDEEEAW